MDILREELTTRPTVLRIAARPPSAVDNLGLDHRQLQNPIKNQNPK